MGKNRGKNSLMQINMRIIRKGAGSIRDSIRCKKDSERK